MKVVASGSRFSRKARRRSFECEIPGSAYAPELLPRIFDLFTQADRTLDRSQGGLGIGLALVERLVQMHGGKVEASSTPGQGSEFVVRLPLVARSHRQRHRPPHLKADETKGPSLRVLVVDDNVDAAQSLAVLLKANGHEVQAVHDGPTALEAAREYRPNLILLDIGLPGMNGFEVAKKVREELELGKVVLGCDDRLRPGHRQTAFAGSRVRSSFGEARRFQRGHTDLDEPLQIAKPIELELEG